MKKTASFLIIFLISLFFAKLRSQEMKNERLEIILNVVSDSIVGNKGAWKFKIEQQIFMCITDENHNRMRIISPIKKQNELTNKDLERLLKANFHTALDVKYALSDEILWAVFIHPLRELSDKQVKDAVSQVYYAVLNFGTTYASTNLIFPSTKKENIESEENIIKEKVIDLDLLRKN